MEDESLEQFWNVLNGMAAKCELERVDKNIGVRRFYSQYEKHNSTRKAFDRTQRRSRKKRFDLL